MRVFVASMGKFHLGRAVTGDADGHDMGRHLALQDLSRTGLDWSATWDVFSALRY